MVNNEEYWGITQLRQAEFAIKTFAITRHWYPLHTIYNNSSIFFQIYITIKGRMLLIKNCSKCELQPPRKSSNPLKILHPQVS